jgi:hypothetical protein
MRPRFSLRLLLIVFTIIAVVLGGIANYVWKVVAEVRRKKLAVKVLDGQRVLIPTSDHFGVYRRPANESFARAFIDDRAF